MRDIWFGIVYWRALGDPKIRFSEGSLPIMSRSCVSKSRLFVRTLLICAAVATAAVSTAQAADQVLLRAREGTAAMLRGQYDQALALYDEALGTPDVSKFVLASIYSDRGVYRPGETVHVRGIGWRLSDDYAPVDRLLSALFTTPSGRR